MQDAAVAGGERRERECWKRGNTKQGGGECWKRGHGEEKQRNEGVRDNPSV